MRPSRIEISQVVVGNYELGYEAVQVVLREGTGGEFYMLPEPGKIARIKIGADYDRWHRVVAVLIHEAGELVMSRMGVRFDPSESMANAMDGFIFVMRHDQYSEVCGCVGDLVAACLPDLCTAHKKWKQRKRK